ncbi:PsbP-related protein [uncultured Winogradskyella sp.]|uniref:PsbP-related protein n=1 Tax=uncultured Winogradskyella sp. TaxID=395353 RepID=UPI002632F5FD|nr:PsbP-related protein [uncultured Winogradskyella sp.]
MKIKISTLLLLFFSLALFAQDNFKRHNGDSFSLDYPNDWTHSKQTPNPAVKDIFLSPENTNKDDQFRENVNLTIEDISNFDLTLEAYTKKALDQVKIQIPSAKVLSQTTTTINKMEVGLIIWSADFGNNMILKFKQLFIISGQKAYVLTFSSSANEYDQYIEIGDRILNSFKLAK